MQIRLIVTFAVFLLAACASAPALWTAQPARPNPSPQPSATRPASPSVAATPSVPPTRQPASPLPPRPVPAELTPAAATSPPIPLDPSAGWRLLDDFPVAAASHVWLTTSGDDFLAVVSPDGAGGCPDDGRPRSRAFSSADGTHWQPWAAGAELPGGPWVELAGTHYALSFASDCPGSRVSGWHAWSSDDGGASWQRLAQSAALRNGRLSALAATDEALVAVGSQPAGSPGEDLSGVWTSADGITWRAARTLPEVDHLGTLAARGSLVVAFGDDVGGQFGVPGAWHSTDAARNWTASDIGRRADGQSVYIQDVVAAQGSFVAVGWTCCLEEPSDWIPVSLVSQDGQSWSGGALLESPWQMMTRVSPIPGGYLALGVEERYPDDDQAQEPGHTSSGLSWLSNDGLSWRPGPGLPELGSGFFTSITHGPAGVLAAGVEPGDRGLRIWLLPLQASQASAARGAGEP